MQRTKYEQEIRIYYYANARTVEVRTVQYVKNVHVDYCAYCTVRTNNLRSTVQYVR